MRKGLANVALVIVVASSFTMMVAGNAQIDAGEPTTPTANATPAITPIPTVTATPEMTPIPTVTATPMPGGPTVSPTGTPVPGSTTISPTTTDIGSGGGAVTTTASPAIPATGSNPSPLAPIGLSAILVGVALLGLVAIRRAKDTRPAG